MIFSIASCNVELSPACLHQYILPLLAVPRMNRAVAIQDWFFVFIIALKYSLQVSEGVSSGITNTIANILSHLVNIGRPGYWFLYKLLVLMHIDIVILPPMVDCCVRLPRLPYCSSIPFQREYRSCTLVKTLSVPCLFTCRQIWQC